MTMMMVVVEEEAAAAGWSDDGVETTGGDGGGETLPGGEEGGGGGATTSGTVTPTSTVTGAAETTLTPRLAERAASGCDTRVVAAAANALLLPKPLSGIVSVAATLTLPALSTTSRMQLGS